MLIEKNGSNNLIADIKSPYRLQMFSVPVKAFYLFCFGCCRMCCRQNFIIVVRTYNEYYRAERKRAKQKGTAAFSARGGAARPESRHTMQQVSAKPQTCLSQLLNDRAFEYLVAEVFRRHAGALFEYL